MKKLFCLPLVLPLLAALLLSLGSCNKEIPEVPDPPPPAKIDTVQLLWAVRSEECYQPILYRNYVAFPYDGVISKDFLTVRDTSTGEKVWIWRNDNIKINSGDVSPDNHFVVGDKLVLCGWDDEVVIDMENRNTHWHDTPEPKGNGEPRFAVIGNFLYSCHSSHDNYDSYLIRSPIEYLQWDTLYQTPKDSLWDASPEPPSLYVNASGDSLLLFWEPAVAWKHPGGPRVRSSLKALNLRTRQVQWERIDFEPDKDCNVQRILVQDGYAYKLGNSTVWCFDAETGATVWSRDFDPQKMGYDHFMGGNGAVIAGGRIIAKTAHYRMASMDLKTGKVIWEVNDGLASNYPLRIYKNKYILYGREGGGGFAVHNLSNGRRIFHCKRIKGGPINGDVAIDDAADRIYWTDGAWAYCFRLALP